MTDMKEINKKLMDAFTEKIINYMQSLDDEHRMTIIMSFCRHCGSKNPHCQCWNDD